MTRPLVVRAFARYRDLLGFDRLELPLPNPATVGALLADPRLERLPKEAMVAVNQAFAKVDTPLLEGDEVALMPPVSGG
jgi:molybdopterin converting factor small subunit